MTSDGTRLELDLHALKDLVGKLYVSHTSLTSLEIVRGELQAQVGHPGLATKLDEFSESWGHKRERLEENVLALAEQVGAIVSGVSGTDNELGSALIGSPQ